MAGFHDLNYSRLPAKQIRITHMISVSQCNVRIVMRYPPANGCGHTQSAFIGLI